MKRTPYFDVVVVGAGAAGVGMGVVLQQLGVESFTLIDRHQVGASFAAWPREMRFITPSFPSNGFGPLDLNSVALGTSPAYSLRTEHPSGFEYAAYLQGVARHFELPVTKGVDVRRVSPQPGGFVLETSRGPLEAACVVWAAGEFQYPRLDPFPGAEHCRHTALVPSWREIAGNETTIIGGYESGIDAAVNLVSLGKRVRVLDPRGRWDLDSSEPSVTLSPYTLRRLRDAADTGRLELVRSGRVTAVEPQGPRFLVRGEKRRKWLAHRPPILATGFAGSLGLVRELFAWTEAGHPLVSSEDESTLAPGLFLAGPALRHDQLIFCFIYKFRQRFAVVAQAIAARLGLKASPLDVYRQAGMFLEDLSCCGAECAC